jgi:hypothetical protein
VIARVADLAFGEGFLQCLEFLQARDVGLFALESPQQVRQARLDAVDIESRDFHRRPDPTEDRRARA